MPDIPPDLTPEWIYILSAEETYRQAQLSGEFITDSLAAEGFIHASPAHQLNRVANRYYTHLPALLLLTVDTRKVQPEIRWEQASDGALYPHLYGPLNVEAIIRVTECKRDPNGLYRIN